MEFKVRLIFKWNDQTIRLAVIYLQNEGFKCSNSNKHSCVAHLNAREASAFEYLVTKSHFYAVAVVNTWSFPLRIIVTWPEHIPINYKS